MKTALNKIQAAIIGAKDAVASVRRTIADLKAERERVESAPLAVSEILDNLDVALRRMAARFEPNLGALSSVDATPGFLSLVGAGRGDDKLEGVEGLLVAIFGAQIREHLAAMIEEQFGDDPDAMTREERRARLADIDRRLLELEREEERMIEQAEEAGIVIDRRPDADPRAVLGWQD